MSVAREILYSFLRTALGHGVFQEKLSAEEWNAIHESLRRQALLGVGFMAIERLSHEYLPSKELVLKWFCEVERIRAANRRLNKDAVVVTRQLQEIGLRAVILKGQGLSLLYPDISLRQPGDIDVWVEGNRYSVMRLLGRHSIGGKVMYHHLDCSNWVQSDVEVHFIPTFFYSPFRNIRLQRFFREHEDIVFTNKVDLPEGQICVPTNSFNRIYILCHIYRHFLTEGVGLRQLLDYYYVLKCGFTPEERFATVVTLKGLGIYRFARGVVYILQRVFGLEYAFCIVPPDERLGTFLLEEILRSGNLGQYDLYSALNCRTGRNRFTRLLQIMRRNSRFLLWFPSEVLWYPLFRVWHWGWKVVCVNYRYKVK